MSLSLAKRAIVNILIVTFAYSPVLGGFTGTVAAAQTTQNTTYNYQYDNMGNLTQVTDSLGNGTNLSYDALQRVKQQIQPAPVTGAARPTSNFTYDGLDQPITVVDPRNLTTTYTNDGLGNRPVLSRPDTGSTSQTFDEAGNVLTSTNASGKVTTYSYDVLNRVTRITYASGTPTVLEYDGGTTGAPNAVGRLTKVTDESGQTTYSYDQAGRILNKLQTSVSAASTVSSQVIYAYNSSGQLVSTTYPSGNRVNYAYDLAGNVNQMTLSPSDGNGGTDTAVVTVLLDQIVYAPFGAAKSWTWGASTGPSPNAYSRTFDLDGRVVTYQLGNPALSSQGVVRTVSYDAGNRITGYAHTGGATASAYDQTFGYDGLGRLTSFLNATSSQSYSYDANGNRTVLSIGGTSYSNTISTSSNRLAATTGPLPAKTNIIDNTGNLTSDGTTSFVYSDRGRLRSATKAGLTTSYLYNWLGQRISKTGSAVSSGGNEYVYDEAGQLIGEYDSAGNVLEESVWLGGAPVIVLKPSTQSGIAAPNIYYVYTDHLSTPRVITDSAGTPVWSWVDADPFGLTQPNEAPGGGASFAFNMRFPGQYFDRETALHYNYFRDYDPQTGRYIESDPIGLGGGINTYAYVAANPLKYADPTGQCIEDFCIGEAIAAASWCAANPACAAGVVALVGGGVYASTIKPPRVNDPEAAAEHQAYKDAYRQPPPPNMDECERLKWQLKREQDLLAARMAWDAKWGSHHADAISQSQRAINNLQEKIKKAGCKCP
jgi:RHS repeat-associated protein